MMKKTRRNIKKIKKITTKHNSKINKGIKKYTNKRINKHKNINKKNKKTVNGFNKGGASLSQVPTSSTASQVSTTSPQCNSKLSDDERKRLLKNLAVFGFIHPNTNKLLFRDKINNLKYIASGGDEKEYTGIKYDEQGYYANVAKERFNKNDITASFNEDVSLKDDVHSHIGKVASEHEELKKKYEVEYEKAETDFKKLSAKFDTTDLNNQYDNYKKEYEKFTVYKPTQSASVNNAESYHDTIKNKYDDFENKLKGANRVDIDTIDEYIKEINDYNTTTISTDLITIKTYLGTLSTDINSSVQKLTNGILNIFDYTTNIIDLFFKTITKYKINKSNIADTMNNVKDIFNEKENNEYNTKKGMEKKVKNMKLTFLTNLDNNFTINSSIGQLKNKIIGDINNKLPSEVFKLKDNKYLRNDIITKIKEEPNYIIVSTLCKLITTVGKKIEDEITVSKIIIESIDKIIKNYVENKEKMLIIEGYIKYYEETLPAKLEDINAQLKKIKDDREQSTKRRDIMADNVGKGVKYLGVGVGTTLAAPAVVVGAPALGLGYGLAGIGAAGLGAGAAGLGIGALGVGAGIGLINSGAGLAIRLVGETSIITLGSVSAVLGAIAYAQKKLEIKIKNLNKSNGDIKQLKEEIASLKVQIEDLKFIRESMDEDMKNTGKFKIKSLVQRLLDKFKLSDEQLIKNIENNNTDINKMERDAILSPINNNHNYTKKILKKQLHNCNNLNYRISTKKCTNLLNCEEAYNYNCINCDNLNTFMDSKPTYKLKNKNAYKMNKTSLYQDENIMPTDDGINGFNEAL
jgi:hypothetical protein